MGRFYTPTFFSDDNYLGSEYGFIVTNRPPDAPPLDELPLIVPGQNPRSCW